MAGLANTDRIGKLEQAIFEDVRTHESHDLGDPGEIPMTAAVRSILESFERLSDAEQHQAATEILRRTATLDYPPLDDEALAQIAELTFLELDAREAADEGRPTG